MRLHHVSIPAPPDRITEGRAFYGDLLGMPELGQPATLEAGSVVWFQAGDGELHLFKEDSAAGVPSGRHFCFAVDDVDEIRARLEHAGVAIEDTTPIHNRPRFFCQDPFGNRLEITELRGPYQ
jgi:catechol 2,3-dioxygenase-like lactoylglutathione lyase family enzyme